MKIVTPEITSRHKSKDCYLDPYLFATSRIEDYFLHAVARYRIFKWAPGSISQVIWVVASTPERAHAWVANHLDLDDGVIYNYVNVDDRISVDPSIEVSNTFFLLLDRPNLDLFITLSLWSTPLNPWFQHNPVATRDFFEAHVRGSTPTMMPMGLIHPFGVELGFSHILQVLDVRAGRTPNLPEFTMMIGQARIALEGSLFDLSRKTFFVEYSAAVSEAIEMSHPRDRELLSECYALLNGIKIPPVLEPSEPPSSVQRFQDRIDNALFGKPQKISAERARNQIEEIKRLQRLAKIGETFETSMQLIETTEAVVSNDMAELLSKIKGKLATTVSGTDIDLDFQLGPGQVSVGGNTVAFREATLSVSTDSSHSSLIPDVVLGTGFGPVAVAAEGAMTHWSVQHPAGPPEFRSSRSGIITTGSKVSVAGIPEGLKTVRTSGEDRLTDITDYLSKMIWSDGKEITVTGVSLKSLGLAREGESDAD